MIGVSMALPDKSMFTYTHYFLQQEKRNKQTELLDGGVLVLFITLNFYFFLRKYHYLVQQSEYIQYLC